MIQTNKFHRDESGLLINNNESEYIKLIEQRKKRKEIIQIQEEIKEIKGTLRMLVNSLNELKGQH